MADNRKKPVLSLSFLPILVLLLVACRIGLSNAQVVETEPKYPIVRQGDKLDLLCKAPQQDGVRPPLLYCRFEIPGMAAVRATPGMQVEDVAWYGERDLEEGECGVTIQRTTDINNGAIKCTLGLKERPEELTGVSTLTVGVAPKPPMFVEGAARDHDRSPAPNNEVFDRICGADGGRPPANITFFLDNEEITDRQIIHEPEFYRNEYDNNTSTARRIVLPLRPEYNGRNLICRAYHFAYPEGMEQVSEPITVQFSPQPQLETTVYGVQFDKAAFVTVTIQANPKPRTKWMIGNIEVQEGSYQERYEARPVVEENKPGFYNVTLVIDKLTIEDTSKVYKMVAVNEHGQQEYTVRISSTGAPLESSPLDIGTIVGIVVAGVLIVVLIGLLIVARATGRWCFAARPDNPRNKNERNVPSDEETGNVKVSAGQQLLTFKQRLVSMVASARKGNNDDEKGIDNDEENEKISTETAIIEDVPKQQQEGKKDPHQLIYAELDIKNPTDVKHQPKKVVVEKPNDKTEYAEILYVSPSSDAANKESETKSKENAI